MRWKPDSPSLYLPDSGQIDLNAIGVEAGQANNSQTALNDAEVRDMIGKASGAQNAMSEYYGASSGDNVGFGPLTSTEQFTRSTSQTGSSTSDMRNGWDLHAFGYHSVGKYSDKLFKANRTVTIEYDVTFSGNPTCYSTEIRAVFIPSRSSPRTALDLRPAHPGSSYINSKPTLIRYRGNSSGTGDVWKGSGNMGETSVGKSNGSRISGTVSVTLRDSGDYQAGVEIMQTSGGQFILTAGTATIHSLTFT